MGPKHIDPPLAEDVDGTHVEGKDSREILINYLTMMWDSERENAERIRRRIELVSGAMVALLGFGFFSIQWVYQFPAKSVLLWPIISTWLLHLLLIGVVLCFARGLFTIYADTRRGLPDRYGNAGNNK